MPGPKPLAGTARYPSNCPPSNASIVTIATPQSSSKYVRRKRRAAILTHGPFGEPGFVVAQPFPPVGTQLNKVAHAAMNGWVNGKVCRLALTHDLAHRFVNCASTDGRLE